jgi:hypothetical protein
MWFQDFVLVIWMLSNAFNLHVMLYLDSVFLAKYGVDHILTYVFLDVHHIQSVLNQ